MSLPLALISLTAFLFLLGLGVLFPVLPFFVRWLGMSEIEAGIFVSSYALASMTTAPLWGRFSERYGRKRALLIGLVGFSAAFGMFGIGSGFWELLFARVAGGLLAGALQPAILTYVVDITPPERRSTALGVVGAAFGLGAICGPVLGGFLMGYGERVPFFATAAIGAAAAIAVALLLPESLTPEIREQAVLRRRELAQRGLTLARIASGLSPFLVYSFLVQAGRTGLESTIGFLVDDRMSGDAWHVGLLLGAAGVVAVGVQGSLRVLSRRYSDHNLMRFGTALLALALLGFAFATSWPPMIASALLFGLGAALLTPTFTAELSRAAEEVQAEAQGMNASAQSFARVVGPVLFTSLYAGLGTTLPYLAGAALCALALALAWRGLRASLA